MGRKYVSDQELLFLKSSIAKYLTKKGQSVAALDLGFGAGRILSVLENSKTIDNITGADFSQKMLALCRKKFRNSKKVKKLIHYNIASQLPFANDAFDVVTSIRAIKYNTNWKEILKECHRILKKDGLFIFEMPNINSINRFSKIEVPIYKTTTDELKQALKDCGFEILKIKGGPMLPGFLYDRIKGPILNLVIFKEKLFKIIFGEIFLSRFLYVACRKI